MLIENIVGIDDKYLDDDIREILSRFGNEKEYFNHTIPAGMKVETFYNPLMNINIHLQKYDDDILIHGDVINADGGKCYGILWISVWTLDGKNFTYLCRSNKEFRENFYEAIAKFFGDTKTPKPLF